MMINNFRMNYCTEQGITEMGSALVESFYNTSILSYYE